MDDEVKGAGNHVDFGARGYDSRLGKWLSMDKVIKPWICSYQFASNNPINYVDPDGNDEIHFYFSFEDGLNKDGEKIKILVITHLIVEDDKEDLIFRVHPVNVGSCIKSVDMKK